MEKYVIIRSKYNSKNPSRIFSSLAINGKVFDSIDRARTYMRNLICKNILSQYNSDKVNYLISMSNILKAKDVLYENLDFTFYMFNDPKLRKPIEDIVKDIKNGKCFYCDDINIGNDSSFFYSRNNQNYINYQVVKLNV